MFRKQKSLVGLDLGSQVVKAVEISLEGPEPVLTGFSCAEIEPGGDVSEALGRALSGGRFKSKNVVTSVSGQSVVVRYITMVEMSDSELRQAIRFESDKYLPFDSDEVSLDCQRLLREPPAGSDGNENGSQMSVVLAACRNSLVTDQVREISRHGLTPVAIDVDVFALANAWELCGMTEGDEAYGDERAIALVDIGASETAINVLCGGETCFSREIGMGGADMTQAAARRLGIEVYDAEQLKRDPEGREAEIGRAITPVLEDLVSEISLSLDYVENREGLRVEEVLLSGGGAQAPGAIQFIEQSTGRPARPWSPLDGIRVDEDSVDVAELERWSSSLAVAVGLASRVRVA